MPHASSQVAQKIQLGNGEENTLVTPYSQPTALCGTGESSLKTSAATARPSTRNHPPTLRDRANYASIGS